MNSHRRVGVGFLLSLSLPFIFILQVGSGEDSLGLNYIRDVFFASILLIYDLGKFTFICCFVIAFHNLYSYVHAIGITLSLSLWS